MKPEPQSDTLTLTANGSNLVLAPRKGGCLVSFTHAGLPVLRGARSKGNGSPFGMAAFPMFPFSGRIASGAFRFAGEDVVLPPNFLPEPHAIHGQSWLATWSVEAADEHAVTIAHEHAADAWPWSYRAEQRFELGERGLRVELALTNQANRPMPGGFGWHPYFPKDDAELTADVLAVWPSGDDKIPTGPRVVDDDYDLRTTRRAAMLDLDHAFTVGAAGSVIRWPSRDLVVRMTASAPLSHLVVFTPPAEDYFCVEPVTHAPNAVNSTLPYQTTGLRVLEAGETLTAEIALVVERG